MKIKFGFLIFMAIMLFQHNDAIAQFGVRLKYNSNNYQNWENHINKIYGTKSELMPRGYEFGVDYWFRLKNKRIEFMPELALGNSRTSYDETSVDYVNNLSYNLNFHTQIYALDLSGDCNCPTFSKEGPSINKGLFFHFTTGISFNNTQLVYKLDPLIDFLDRDFNNIALKAGIGIGLDFGINDLVTITPIVSYYFNSTMVWENLDSTMPVGHESKVNLSQLQFSLRLGFRPDYGRRRFR